MKIQRDNICTHISWQIFMNRWIETSSITTILDKIYGLMWKVYGLVC